MQYLIPMSKITDDESVEKYVPVNVVVKNFMCVVKAVEDGYRTKYFLQEYFDWLVHTGYIKVVNK